MENGVKRRVVIIGGSGFLGRVISDALHNSYDVVIMDLKPADAKYIYVFHDIRNELGFEFNADDVVIHLAAAIYDENLPRHGRDEYFLATNTAGTKNILERMEKCGASKMIFYSTDMVYGAPDGLPVRPSHARRPFGPYGASKKEAEDICDQYRKRGFDITIFRPRIIVGPGRCGLLSKLFKLIALNLPIPMIGSGHNCYQMVGVKDCAQAAALAIEKGFPNRQYNLGSKNPPTVKDLLHQVIDRAGSKSFLFPTWGKAVKAVLGIMGSMGLDIMYKEQYMIADENYIVSTDETEQELGWNPEYSDLDMMSAAYESYLREKKQ